MSTEYNELMVEKQKIIDFIEEVEKEITQARIHIEVGEERISTAKGRIAEIDRRLAEIQGV